MRKIYTILIAVFSLTLSYSGHAQQKNISGTVTSKADGSTLPGVSVVVQGTTRGTETDFDGNYAIKASVGDVLSFSFLGMKTLTITVSDSSIINVQLEEDSETLNEIVVTALGIKKTRKSKS